MQYYTLGAEKRLNEIVMAGSHDAGITKGGGHAKTQGLSIYMQAKAGVRIFDLRISGEGPMVVGTGPVDLRAYHGPKAGAKVTAAVTGLQAPQSVTVSKVMGTWGENLVSILNDAKTFVDKHKTEFLILKFDKCENWPQIAALCVQELSTFLYTDGGNLNKKRLFDLKKKVIVGFTPKGLDAIDPGYHGTGGIVGIKSLTNGGTYEKDYDGIQYYGKGGTDMTTRKGKSVKENYNKQLDLMHNGAKGNANVMGMMYWTTTGTLGNIKSRNNMMWKPKYQDLMFDLWQQGLGDAVKERAPAKVDPKSFVGGTIYKRFLPNFVMIDFANTSRCQTIFNLNNKMPKELSDYEQAMIALNNFK